MITDRDKLIFVASFSLTPYAYVLLYLSEPAKSTKLSLPALILGSSCPIYTQIMSFIIDGFNYIFRRFNVDSKYRMTPTAIFIHCSFSYFPIAWSLLHQFLNLSDSFYDEASQVLNKHATIRIFLQLQLRIYIFRQ